ncbi:MAG TPA: 2-hydroxyacid dehydrogenase, partial [Alphaproteobacteria bacterium]|nr:2-hydroxyacid dehydrogenase [Alphaproteobacteria bacterium]
MRILLNGAVARRGAEALRRRFGEAVELDEIGEAEEAEAVAAKFARAEVVISMSYDGGFPPAPRLKLLQLPISGLDTVDLAAVPAGASVCNVYEHEIGIAEYVFAGMLAWTVDLTGRDARFRTGDWGDSPRFGAPPRGELAGRTVGLLGYGNIGQAVARRALAFGMTVKAVTRNPRPLEPEPAFLGPYEALDDVLSGADFLVVCCPLTEATRGLVGEAELMALPDGAVLINVARGAIVDEDALYRALQEGRLGGAVLDTWYQYAEPAHPDLRPSRHPFHELDNVLMTPHLSGWTEGQQR